MAHRGPCPLPLRSGWNATKGRCVFFSWCLMYFLPILPWCCEILISVGSVFGVNLRDFLEMVLQRFQHWLPCSIRSCNGTNTTTSRPKLLMDALNGTIAIRRNSSSSKVETSPRKKQRHVVSCEDSIRSKVPYGILGKWRFLYVLLVVSVGELLCERCFFFESDFRLVMVLYVSRSPRNSWGDDPVW